MARQQPSSRSTGGPRTSRRGATAASPAGVILREPVVIDDAVERELEAAVELAPLHNAPALAAIRQARQARPDLPHVAVFDSAFHATIPPEASTYALPARARDDR